MEDTKIIDLYFARDEQALAETERKYGGYCFSLANAILGNVQDSEETVSDTYWKTWEAIPPVRPVSFRMFLAKITRNLAFSRWRSSVAQKRGSGELDAVLDELEECIRTPGNVEDGLNLKELQHTIIAFLNTVSISDQNIFLRRYFYVEETEAIAERYGMRTNTVRKSLSRTRQKLKTYLIREGYAV